MRSFLELTWIGTRTTDKAPEHKDKISAYDLIKTLQSLGEKPTKSEADLMIWVRGFNKC